MKRVRREAAAWQSQCLPTEVTVEDRCLMFDLMGISGVFVLFHSQHVVPCNIIAEVIEIGHIKKTKTLKFTKNTHIK